MAVDQPRNQAPPLCVDHLCVRRYRCADLRFGTDLDEANRLSSASLALRRRIPTDAVHMIRDNARVHIRPSGM
jgi:hypothetical protein